MQAISSPNDEDTQLKAWQILVPLVATLRRCYEFSLTLGCYFYLLRSDLIYLILYSDIII